LVFRDSLKLLPASLDELGNSFLKRSKMDVDYSFITNCAKYFSGESVGLILGYVEKDVAMLCDMLNIFRKEIAVNFGIEMSGCITLRPCL
jgi:hypothetical protein